VKIADFGLSEFFRPGTNFVTDCGSLSYIAPEVLLGKAMAGCVVWCADRRPGGAGGAPALLTDARADGDADADTDADADADADVDADADADDDTYHDDDDDDYAHARAGCRRARVCAARRSVSGIM
jgi:serine/threonine protein kinase